LFEVALTGRSPTKLHILEWQFQLHPHSIVTMLNVFGKNVIGHRPCLPTFHQEEVWIVERMLYLLPFTPAIKGIGMLIDE
jgi:hypothetical protein